MTLFRSLCPPPPRNVRRILRVAGWNLIFILAGLLLIGIAGEAYFRSSGWFDNIRSGVAEEPPRWSFVPGVGLLRPPHTELVFDYTVQRANSLGFMDREPIGPLRADESCHIAIIGDSFVEGREVHISDKMQVQLEEIAAHEAPNLDVTVSAYGIMGTGQVNQLPFYDGYARHLNPDLMVLAFVDNDLIDNSTVSASLLSGMEPGNTSRVHAVMSSDGAVELRLPNTDAPKRLLPPTPESLPSWRTRFIKQATKTSRLARWLQLRLPRFLATPSSDGEIVARVQELIGRQEHAWMFDGWIPTSRADIDDVLLDGESSVFQEVWGITEFALEQFKRRADHDGVDLMILSAYILGDEGDPMFDVLNGIATSLDIPVVSQQSYIDRQGYSTSDAHFRNDLHWSPTGHRWAAEAVWEYIEDKWDGECPSSTPDPDVEVDWIKVGSHIHTPEGKFWSVPFPKDLNLYREAYISVSADAPIVRSDWNVHLYEDGVTYTKDQCTAEDIEHSFFLHVVPEEDVLDLPENRREYGFQSTTFHFLSRGALFDGQCIASMDLPAYEIARIRTGQFIRDIDSDVEVWSVRYNFALPEIMNAVNELRQSEREPEIRSVFDVYIDDSRLLYAKSPCADEDGETPFFLHVFLADEADLPAGRDDSGFDNLGFELIDKGGMHDGGCFAAVDLPGYDIASIRTGQVVGGAETWRAYHNFNFPETLDAVQEIRRSGREPDIRSNFDVYIDDGRLIYVKDSCTAHNRDLPFFLHVFPADESDLPDDRQEFGFDNLDFELMQRGGELNGDCFAVVGLPAYDVASIRTGQWVRGEGEVWEASIEFGR